LPNTIERQSLRDTVADAVRAMVASGELADGERINEVQLAEQLGVSRTPVREGLNRLAAEGELSSSPSYGYTVKPLTLDEFEPIYAMRPILDPAALQLAGLPSAQRMQRLRDLNARLETSRDAARSLDLDDQWHRELVAACPNPVLLDLIEQFIRRTRRYEIALMREQPQVAAASEDHRIILRKLARRDLDGACEALRLNLMRGGPPITAWLKKRLAR